MSRFQFILVTAALSLVGCSGPAPVDESLELIMVPIEGGSFVMGDVIENEHPDALPLHDLHVEPFRLSKYETTFAQYDAFAEAEGRPLPSDDGHGRGRRAVTNVSWNEAVAFCGHHGLRLPSEAEWEYAARDGGERNLYAGTNSRDSLTAYAFTSTNGAGFSMPVGLKKPTKFGLHDMTGNASEWVGPFYERYPANGEKPVYKDLDRPGFRITRGGSFASSGEGPAAAHLHRTYWRAGTLDEVRSFAIGFRCAD